MFDLFGIKARKKAREEKEKKEKERIEAEKLALAKENKAKYQERKSKIEKYLEKYRAEMKDIAFSEYMKISKMVDEENCKCPKCGSRNVINKIVRTKGELHGKGSNESFSLSTSSDGLFTPTHYSHSYSYGNSKIDGKLDTYPVNKCNECGNEWYIKKAEMPREEDDFETYSSPSPRQLFYVVKDFLKMKYDPFDVTDKCNSLEEKQEKQIERTSVSDRFKAYRNAPRYMVEYALYLGIMDVYYLPNELDKCFNFNFECDKYSYTMSDELWEIVKRLIGWKEKAEENK